MCECTFSAAQWLREATEKEIIALAKCGWGEDYAADQVAIYMADWDDDVQFMFKYIEKVNGKSPHSNIGFECNVDKDDALTFLKKARPNIYEKVASLE